jgi:hypothetical protein
MKNNNRKLGKCICKTCEQEFEKPQSEITRNEKLNRPNFCSRSCVGKHNIKNFKDKCGDIQNLKGFKRTGDLYTKFRYHYRNILKRNHEVGVTVDDLKEQWENQDGVCKFSGVKLVLSTYTKINKNPIYAASLDRIDSNKGYIKGNIRWVSRAINWMKNDMSDDMVDQLINIIVENKKSPK